MTHSPYEPPQANMEIPPTPPPTKPAVYQWYVVYCVCMALMYFFVVGLAVLSFFVPDTMVSDEELPPAVMGAILLVVGFPLFGLFAIAPFLKKNKTGWIVGIVAIGIGMTSACCIPASLPLLIYWIKPETKRFFGMK